MVGIALVDPTAEGAEMFAYTDPVGTGVLEARGALEDYRTTVHSFYRRFALLPQSAFTLLEAFEGINTNTAEVPWIAFPKTANASDAEIDENRFSGGPFGSGFQDEYVEWRVEKDGGGNVTRMTFTTEFPEYYEVLAGIGQDALVAAIADAIPGAAPTTAELFGPGFDPNAATKTARQRQFVAHLPDNPWQNGQKGILCLQQRFNTMNALFNLVGECAITLPGSTAEACGNASSGACGPDRNSDPKVCTAAQELRRAEQVVVLADPAGIRLLEMGGIWKLDGQQIDINDTTNNQGVWAITRNGRRGTLNVTPALTFIDDPIVTGTQVSRVLKVGAAVVSAPEADVPPWARTGQESSRRIV